MRVTVGIHPVREALKARRPLDKVLVAKGSAGLRIQEIIELCRKNDIPVRFEPREILDRASKGVAHQGVVGFGAAYPHASFEAVDATAQLLVLLDGVEDPHNLGAIIRTAHAAGATAVIVPERRSAPLTEAVSRTASGALSYLPVIRVVNISRAMQELKKKGFWIYGMDEGGTASYDQIAYANPSAFIFGAEGSGLHQNVKQHCDFLVRIPMSGRVSSLNVSVAAGIALFEWRRQQAVTSSPKSA